MLVIFRCCVVLRPGGIPAKNSKGEQLLLYLGIIDILQSFRLKKRLEHTMKAVITDGVGWGCQAQFQCVRVCVCVCEFSCIFLCLYFAFVDINHMQEKETVKGNEVML